MARHSQPVLGGIGVSAEGVTALDGIANVASRRTAPQPALAAVSAPAAALGSLDASGVHAQTSPDGSPAGIVAEEPFLEDGTVPHVARQPSQPVSQGDEASAELDSGAADMGTDGPAEEQHGGADPATEEQVEDSDDDSNGSLSDSEDIDEITPARRRKWINGQLNRILRIVSAVPTSTSLTCMHHA